MKILVTGGAGFIGSAFVRMIIGETDLRVVNLDALPYAGNLENLTSVEADPRCRFVHGDICDGVLLDALLSEEKPDAIVHFAAESHVDRSILSPEPVIQTNLRGTFTLLEGARKHRQSATKVGTFTLLEGARKHRLGRFVHVSTDEV